MNIKKIEAGENVYALCGNRAHTEEQAYNTLLGRCKKGQIKPQKSFFQCKDCGTEFEVCPNCMGELQRRFKKWPLVTLFSKKRRARNELSTDFRKIPLRVFLNVFILFFGVREVNKINIFQAQLWLFSRELWLFSRELWPISRELWPISRELWPISRELWLLFSIIS